MIPRFKDKRDLADRKKALKALVKESLKKAHEQGFELAQGVYRGIDDSGAQAVCLVGAIGVARKPSIADPVVAHVAPLIRNGESKLVDDFVLEILEDGFEDHNDKILELEDAEESGYADALLIDYLRYAHDLAIALGEKANDAEQRRTERANKELE